MKTCKKPPPTYNDLALARDRASEAYDRIKAQDKERKKKEEGGEEDREGEAEYHQAEDREGQDGRRNAGMGSWHSRVL